MFHAKEVFQKPARAFNLIAQMDITEVGICKRKFLREKVRKLAFAQDQKGRLKEKKRREHDLDLLDQENKKANTNLTE